MNIQDNFISHEQILTWGPLRNFEVFLFHSKGLSSSYAIALRVDPPHPDVDAKKKQFVFLFFSKRK